MDTSLRLIVSGLLGAVLAHFLIRWLGRRFPIGRRPHSLSWYEKRYAWVEKVCLAAFAGGIGVALLLYRATQSRNDPRGAAVGFVLGCFLSMAVLFMITWISHTHTFRGIGIIRNSSMAREMSSPCIWFCQSWELRYMALCTYSSRASKNHSLQLTAAGHRGCNRRVSWLPSLSLDRQATTQTASRKPKQIDV